jgi:hypothetical protein
MKVAIEWDESYRRTAQVDVDEAQVRDWLDQPEGPISAEDLRRYLDHEFTDICDDTTWLGQVGNLNPQNDEFLTLDVESAVQL